MTTPVPDRDSYLKEWSVLHGEYDPVGGPLIVRQWLALVYRLGRPIAARGVSPSTITVAAAVMTAAMLPPVVAGGRWPLLAAVLVVVGGLLDNLDGCVAVLTGRVTAWGYVLDSLADRVADTVCLVAFWLLGAPGEVCAAAGVALGLLEYLRARAGNAGFGEIGVVTIGERPTRIIIAMTVMLAAAADPVRAHLAGLIGAAGTFGVCAVGLVQLATVINRTLDSAGRSAAQVVLRGTDHVSDDLRGHGDQRQAAARMRRPAHQEQTGDR